MVEKCDVSVIIPNFNRSHFLARALNSICQQEALPMEEARSGLSAGE